MLKIALTGGIGTGKSYILRKFFAMDIPVYCADIEAKYLYYQPDVKQKVKGFFGEGIFTDNEVDLKKMAVEIFSDTDKMKFINTLISPLIMKDFNFWAAECNSPIVIMETAIIYENKLETFFDLVIVVDAAESTRIERLKKRETSLTEEMIWQRIHSQIPQEEKVKRADLIIDNDEENQWEIIYKPN